MTLTNLAVHTSDRPSGHRPDLVAAFEAAADLLPPVRSMTEFVAMNPLAGLEHLPFADAMARASDVFGASGYLPEPRYRELHERGRIRTRHLRTALLEALGDPRAPSVAGIDPVDVLLADLLASPEDAPAGRRLRTLAERHAGSAFDPTSIETQVVRWCAAYLGGGSGRWSVGGDRAELYPWWRGLAAHDRRLPVGARPLLSAIPVDPVEATAHIFDRCGIRPEDEAESIVAELTALPGWAATLQASDGAIRAAENVTALRLSLTIAELGWPTEPLLAVRRAGSQRARASGTDPDRRTAVLGQLGLAVDDLELGALVDRTLSLLRPGDRAAIWQRAYELTFRSELVGDLGGASADLDVARVAPEAQVVCCIDVRSEGLRRQLERLGGYETFGFAGFFALPMRWRPATGGHEVASCPVPVTPGFDVVESAAGAPSDRRILADGISRFAGASEGRRRAKSSPAAPYLYAEAAGWVTGPSAALRTLAPTSWTRLADLLRRRALRPRTTDVDLSAIPLDQQVTIAANALRTMGLTSFAPLVVLCGHSSDTSANPYEAGLRCGACGGHGGGPNARVLARILNDPRVRAELAAASITVPPGTHVLAAEHDTTTDRVTLLDTDLVPPSHRERVERLRVDLQLARLGLAHERSPQLPGARATTPVQSVQEVERRAADWAEPCPEWGLAGNAAFIIGPRSTTRAVDLGRRVFLHSYDPELDPSGAALEVILTAPLVVAHGINAQYHFASTAPDVFGAGSKAVHNPVGTFGILSGASGDLRLGLPRQSVAVGDQLLHEPLRLLAVVEAPLERIATILEHNPGLGDLVTGGWLPLIARSSAADPWHERTPTGWRPLTADAQPSDEP